MLHSTLIDNIVQPLPAVEEEQSTYHIRFVDEAGDEVCTRDLKAWSHWDACVAALDILTNDAAIDDFQVI